MKKRSVHRTLRKRDQAFDLVSFFGWVLLCEMVGILGSAATVPAIPTWYAALTKPSFSPPNWVFGPVWTVLYALMGLAAYRIARLGGNKRTVKQALALFGVQLFLNFIWSFIFFSQRNIPAAFVDISILWVVLLVLVIKFERLDRIAGYLMIPYLFWVSFATILNYSLWFLNM